MPDSSPLQMELVTALGASLKFKSMSALEEVARLFEFEVVAVSPDETVSADDLLGTVVAVSLEVADGTKRWFSGIVAAFGIDGVEGREHRYRISLRPWLWLLTRAANMRIFQAKSTLDIVKQVFGDYSGTFVDETTGVYPPRTYCVQYRETDFNFVSRLLEEEGIFYYFRHAEDKHELVLADASGTHATVPGFETVHYLEDEKQLAEVQAINEWRMRHEIQTGKLTLNDYNFATPATSLKSTTATMSREHAEAAYEVYDYPGLFTAKAAGDKRAEIRRDEAAGRFTRFIGAGNAPGIVTGTRFTLDNHPRADQNAEYLVLQTQIDMQIAGYESGVDETLFLCRFIAQRYAEPFRPQRTTRKPTVAGPQTALVVGDGGDGDITTDEHGRIKVQFFWDRLGQKNASSSCWVRVASPWAGNGWGMIALPRIGQEVVVDFLEGDPDQPIITGRVHNALQKTPYELPANATVSTVKSRSKQGAAADFNELRFEDLAGSEYMLLHAQKDRLEFVENDLKSKVDNNEHVTVANDRLEMIGGEHHLQVAKDVKHKLKEKYSLDVAKDILFKSGGKFSLKTAEDVIADSGATISFKSSGDMHLKIGANIGADAAQNVHIKSGMNIVIEGGVQVSIKAGGSSIVLGPAGVSITGTMVMINSGGAPGSGNGASPVAPTDPDPPTDPELPTDPLKHR